MAEITDKKINRKKHVLFSGERPWLDAYYLTMSIMGMGYLVDAVYDEDLRKIVVNACLYVIYLVMFYFLKRKQHKNNLATQDRVPPKKG